MSYEIISSFFAKKGLGDRVMKFDTSSATVELAAAAIGTEPARIAKTISFKLKDEDRAVLIVTAGDTKIDNAAYKARFGCKAVMLRGDEVEYYTGNAVGGVCPFCLPADRCSVYLDESLDRFDVVYPACGSADSAVKLTVDELFELSGALDRVKVCKLV